MTYKVKNCNEHVNIIQRETRHALERHNGAIWETIRLALKSREPTVLIDALHEIPTFNSETFDSAGVIRLFQAAISKRQNITCLVFEAGCAFSSEICQIAQKYSFGGSGQTDGCESDERQNKIAGWMRVYGISQRFGAIFANSH